MDKKKVTPVKAPESKSVPLKPAQKKRRIFLWLFLSFFLLGGLVGAAFFYRLIPMSDETAAAVEPYLIKAEEIARSTGESLSSLGPFFAKLKFWQSTDEAVADGKPKTNFPLVELNESAKPSASGSAPPAATILGPPAVAAAAPFQQPTAVGNKPSAKAVAGSDNAKAYAKLAKLYGAMKPEEVVAVFRNLEDEQVIPILTRMEEEAASKALAAMEPKRAARLTQAIIKNK